MGFFSNDKPRITDREYGKEMRSKILGKLSGSWTEKKRKFGVLDAMTNASKHEREDKYGAGIQKDEWDGTMKYMHEHHKDLRLTDKDIDAMDAEGQKHLKD